MSDAEAVKMSQLSAVKESKSAATIRRRRHMGILQGRGRSTEEEGDSQEEAEPSMDKITSGPAILRLLLASERTLFLGLLAFRVLNALLIQTSFVPDEYWQSLEVAHQMAYGYGHLTWEWKHGIRSYVYPSVFAGLYKLLHLLHLDYRILLIKLPRVLQAVLAAAADFYLFKFSWRLHNQRVALWTLFCQMTSWFTFYAATRTLTNSTETALTTIALYYYPWPGTHRRWSGRYVALVALAVVVRPTAAILWSPLCLWHVWRQRHNVWSNVRLYGGVGVMVLGFSSLVDKLCYGRWVNVHYNFLELNVLSNIGAFYGSHPWYWYLSQGLAVILGTHLFPFILGARNGSHRVILGLIAWTVFIYSLLEHKEFRFLFPVLPLCMHVCGQYLYTVCHDEVLVNDSPVNDSPVNDSPVSGRDSPVNQQQTPTTNRSARRWFVMVTLIVTNLPLAMYTSLIHQRGSIEVMKRLHDDTYKTDVRLMNVLFLTPCHATPYYSYLHRNVSMEFLTCEPNLAGEADYVDEADQFFQDPVKWMAKRYPKNRSTLPTHLVMYSPTHLKLHKFLARRGYMDSAKFFHTHVPEGQVGSHIIITCQVEWKIMSTMTPDMRTGKFDNGNTIDIGEDYFKYKGKDIPTKKSRQKV